METERKFQIVGIGANVYDTLIKVPAFPIEDEKSYVETVVQSGGGPCATGLCTAARLGATTAALAVLSSSDAGGKFLIDDFCKRGVDTTCIDWQPGESFSATVLLNSATGSRTCLLNRGTLPKLQLNLKKYRQTIENADILMVDGNELGAAIEGAEIARDSGTKVLYDAGGLYPGIEPLLKRTDLLIPSAEFALGHTGRPTIEDAAQELYRRYEPEIVVVTNGARGGILFDGQNLKSYPAFTVNVVDSNGAGDVFHGAFAFAVTRKKPYLDCCVFASAVSALKCTRLGARDGVPALDEVVDFMNNCLLI